MPTDLERGELLAEKVDRREFIDLLRRMLIMDQERRITPNEALNHPFVTMNHLADYAHCAIVKSSSKMMENPRRPVNNNNSTAAAPLQNQLIAAAAAATIVPARSNNGNVTLTFNNQLSRHGLTAVRERSTAYDTHLQTGAATAAVVPPGALLQMPTNYQPLASPATKHVVVQQPPLQGPPPQYVPVTMVENGRHQIMAAAVQQAGGWPPPPGAGRQMAIVPGWQPTAAGAAGAESLLQPLFAAPDPDSWLRPLQGQQAALSAPVFPVVYDSRSSSYVSGSKRSTKPTPHPPPAHSNSTYCSSSRMSYVKKEQTQLSPVKKRIKENKDHYVIQEGYQYGVSPPSSSRRGVVTIHDTPPLGYNGPHGPSATIVKPPPEVITISDSDDEPSENETNKASTSKNSTEPAASTSSATNTKKGGQADLKSELGARFCLPECHAGRGQRAQ